eukprot:CAMPEP_0177433900 /NCGR_PEP_ID=MMETSP0369-20130122/78_1 /TAXON_ID=447022 ORGANISM="Scrippsiella hangoei-like, Strain SHHI-4" /NCGR_SAMPLE_ID=MMETSP0369 /ASSEMBLY_ACC=CAM_ASM_000364 /LENGTH=89 /DNA_ID=CAMNT_0018904651 /DNA_START=142 /DNA_END=411 /DNA_ORIENTATION=-
MPVLTRSQRAALIASSAASSESEVGDPAAEGSLAASVELRFQQCRLSQHFTKVVQQIEAKLTKTNKTAMKKPAGTCFVAKSGGAPEETK